MLFLQRPGTLADDTTLVAVLHPQQQPEVDVNAMFDFRVPQLLRRGTRPRFLGRGFSGDLLIVGHLLDRLVHPITVN